MTTARDLQGAATFSAGAEPPLIEVRNLVKHFGAVVALAGVSLTVRVGEVHCLIGDNGAGKSTLIKTLSGVYRPTGGDFLFEGKPVRFSNPRDALDLGIATVFQDLAMIPLLSITRNFFMGREPVKNRLGPFSFMDMALADKIVHEDMRRIGIDVRDPQQPVGTLRRRAPVRCDRAGRSLRRQGAHPRRANLGAGRRSDLDGPEVRASGTRQGTGHDLHHS